MKKVVIIAESGWSVETVHNSVIKELRTKYEFIVYSATAFVYGDFMRNFKEADVCLTTFNFYRDMLRMFPDPNDLRKILIVCHGYPDLLYINCNNLDPNLTYGITSDVLLPFYNISPVYITPNGIDSVHFTYKEHSGIIKTLGWCGAIGIPTKRYTMGHSIAAKTRLPISYAATMSFQDVCNWYKTIDILLVTAGPEEHVETGPLPPFEAIASGCIAIGTPVGNFRKVPGPKFNTVEEAVEIIEKLKANPEMCRELAKEQYEYVMANWTMKTLALEWDKAFIATMEKAATT